MSRGGVPHGFDPARSLGAALILFVFVIEMVSPQEAFALPSFARQTGLGCGTCHTEFPQLTPFGRRFKILGYTLGYSVPEDKRVLGNTTAYPSKDQRAPDPSFPVSVQAIATFTHTGADQNIAGSAPYLKPNDRRRVSSMAARSLNISAPTPNSPTTRKGLVLRRRVHLGQSRCALRRHGGPRRHAGCLRHNGK